jgi:hypothetical protein
MQKIKLLKESELAKWLSVSARTIRRLRSCQIFPFYRIGHGLIRYNREQCQEALDQYRVRSLQEVARQASTRGHLPKALNKSATKDVHS